MKAPENTITLSTSESAAIVERLDATPNPRVDFDAFRIDAIQAAGALPARLIGALLALRNDPLSPPYLLVHTGITEVLTEGTGSQALFSKRTHRAEGCIGVCASVLGEMFGYEGEHEGALIQRIIPRREDQRRETATGSDVELRLHVENVFSIDLMPDFVLLFCVRSDPHHDALTYWTDARAIYASLPERSAAVLRQPKYRFPVPESFRTDGSTQPLFGPLSAVFIGPECCPEMRLDFTGMEAIDAESDAALDELRARANGDDQLYSRSLVTSDLLILNNRRAAHGRSPIKANFERPQSLRWLERSFVLSDLWRVRQFRTARPRVYYPSIYD